MSPNQILVRNIVGVVTTIAAVTTVSLWLGRPGRQQAASSARAARTIPRGVLGSVELGARLYETKGCGACHTIDGTPRVGPSFKGSWGSDVTLAGDITLRFDEAYVRESLLHPQAKARAGYPPTMPSYDGMLSDREIDALIAFIGSLR